MPTAYVPIGMSWNPFRRRRDDTIPVTTEMIIDEPASCVNCEKVFRNSPGNWHQESPSEGLCNTCDHSVKNKLRRPYSRTRIGF